LRVACVGHAALDHVWSVQSMPGPGKTLAHGFQYQPGGMSLHAAIASARLGAAARMLGRVGDDAVAEHLRQCLVDEGVQPQGLEAVAGTTTSVASVIVDAQGERQIVPHRGRALERAHALDTRQLDGADVVLVDPRWMRGAVAALRWARANDRPSLVDADVAPLRDLQRLVGLARWVAFSQPGFAVWAGDADPDTALSAVLADHPQCRLALVTLGAQGARWVERGVNGVQHCAAPQVQAVDTTGAGDVFHAALALALAEQRPTAAAVAWACAAAAMKCERGFGTAGAPTRRELAAWMKRRGLT
jgi:sulfofructose kinase